MFFFFCSGKLIALNVEARQNFARFNNGLNITPGINAKVLWNEARVVNARLLFEAGHLRPLEFVKWCRTSVRNTLAIVRQGRRLRRLLKAEQSDLHYDEVCTSSDSSVAR